MQDQAAARQPSAHSGMPPAPEFDARAQLRLWLQVLDAVLGAVERCAWEARALGDAARDALPTVQGVFARLWFSSKALAGEAANAWQLRLVRLTTTALTLARIVTAYRLHTTKAAFMSRAAAARARAILHQESARRLYELCARQGGALLKVGQLLSSRPDLLPAPFIHELARLQDAAPPVPFSQIMVELERELGRPLEELFAAFEEEPLAAASIGQVHRATLPDGREVAVKVQRPQIAALVAADLELLEPFVWALADALPPMDLDTVIRETRTMILAELDYEREARCTERAAQFFADDPHIHVPEVIRELSTKRVLVTSFMEGEKLTTALDRLLVEAHEQGDIEAGEARARERITTLLVRVLEAYVRQALVLGQFQADPHPGNLLATADDGLILLDFGCAKELSATQRASLVVLARGFVMRDARTMAEALEGLGFATQSGTRDSLERYAQTVLDEVGVVRARGGDWPTQVELLAQTALMVRFIEGDPIVRLPDEFVMLARVFGTLSGLFLHYRPDVAAAARILPLALMG